MFSSYLRFSRGKCNILEFRDIFIMSVLRVIFLKSDQRASSVQTCYYAQNDSYYSISISILDNSTDRKTLMDMLERHRCYDFRNGDNYTKGDFYIEEKPYYQEFQMGILYFCDNGRDLVVIDYKGPLGMDVDDSPVDGILDSFVFVEENRCIS